MTLKVWIGSLRHCSQKMEVPFTKERCRCFDQENQIFTLIGLVAFIKMHLYPIRWYDNLDSQKENG